jgi:hypothetical protein
MNFKFSIACMFVLFVFHKKTILLIVHPLKIYPNTKCHGPLLTGVGFASTSEVTTSAILE